MTAHPQRTDANTWLAERFEDHRAHLKAVAFRMLGSVTDAEDAVQESWLRLSRTEANDVENLRAWLTTVVSRVCLNMLRSRASSREVLWDSSGDEKQFFTDANAEQEALLADSVGLALLVVLDKLTPAERLAFVLHDLFDLPFEEIAPIVRRTPAAARQLASRARRRVQGAGVTADEDLRRRREVVEAFLAAARSGDFERLLAVLDPNVVLRTVGIPGQPLVVRGSRAVVKRASVGGARFARFCQVALIDGVPGIVVAPRGRLFRVLTFEVVGERIVSIEVIGDRQRVRSFSVMMPA